MAESKTRATGYTLIELMIVLVIAGVLLLVGVPSFRNQIQNGRLTGTTSDFASSLAVAKAEAIARSDVVQMCKTTDSATCADTNFGWEVGWLTFVDLDDDGVVDVDYVDDDGVPVEGEQILRIQEPFNKVLAGRVEAGPDEDAGPDVDIIRFSPSGITSLPGTLTVMFCDNRVPLYARGVVVSILGKASILSAVDDDVNNDANVNFGGALATALAVRCRAL